MEADVQCSSREIEPRLGGLDADLFSGWAGASGSDSRLDVAIDDDAATYRALYQVSSRKSVDQGDRLLGYFGALAVAEGLSG